MSEPRACCLHEVFEAHATARPDATALTCGEQHLTFRGLSRRTNQLAHDLRACGVGPERRVGICAERSDAIAIGRLAVLKAGGAYVPIDPSAPLERIAAIVRDADVSVLLTDRRAAARVGSLVARCIDLEDRRASGAEDDSPPAVAVTPQNLAYVLYTSGSTGQPKGVLMPHAPVVHFTQALASRLALTADDRMLQFAAVSFDVVEEELWPVWARGGTVVTFTGRTLSLRELDERVTRDQITIVELPTAYWQSWVAESSGGDVVSRALRLVLMGGERASPAAVARWQGWRLPLIHVYGLTETAITTLTCDRADASGELPLGRPLEHMHVYDCDADGALVPPGATGELYIGGVGLARGYLHQPALTAARFVPDPFGEERGARLYRTGDRVHRRADGELIFLGRADHQVKLHGYRIELSEVEAVIARHPRVVAAAVAVREPSPGQPLLVAYVVGDVDEDALRAFAATQLPDYMLPARVVRVTQLPLSANGKIDRRALPPLSTALPPSPPPADDAFAGMWADVLGRAGAASRSPRADRADTQEPPS